MSGRTGVTSTDGRPAFVRGWPGGVLKQAAHIMPGSIRSPSVHFAGASDRGSAVRRQEARRHLRGPRLQRRPHISFSLPPDVLTTLNGR
ncbi:MAG: hypothetical protein OXC62_10160 [Aestuariivita sp.]|nr:hypothetical protein [Aestuariivita sp.]